MKSTRSLRLALVTASVAGAFSSVASANLLTNGSFESYSATPNTLYTVTPSSFDTTHIPGWSVTTTADSGFAIANFAPAADGSTYFAFNAADTAANVVSIHQDFATVAGVTYVVSFTGGRFGPGSGNTAITANAFAGDFSTSLGSASAGTSAVNPSGSVPVFGAPTSFQFTATGPLSRIQLFDVSNATGAVDLLVDNVSVSAVPEPASFAAIAGAVLLGFAGVRRRRAVSV